MRRWRNTWCSNRHSQQQQQHCVCVCETAVWRTMWVWLLCYRGIGCTNNTQQWDWFILNKKIVDMTIFIYGGANSNSLNFTFFFFFETEIGIVKNIYEYFWFENGDTKNSTYITLYHMCTLVVLVFLSMCFCPFVPSVLSWFWVGQDVRHPPAAHDPQSGDAVVSVYLISQTV